MLKKVLFFHLFLLLTVSSFAQNLNNRRASLNVFSNGAPFYIYINNILYNTNPHTKVSIEDLPNNAYDVRIEFASSRTSFATMSRLFMYNELGDPLDVTLFAHTDRRSSPRLILYSLFPMDAPSIDLNQFSLYTFGRPQVPVFVDQEYFYGEQMTPVEFNDFLTRLKRQSFDKDKIVFATTATSGFYFSVDQIAQAMRLFSWDEGKMEFAQLMYNRCLDQANYFSLVDMFSFLSSKDKFKDFLKSNANGNGYINHMNKADFDNLLRLLKKESFDNDKVKFLASVNNANSFNVAQIRALLQAFSFDDGKLQAAKILYPNCNDKRGYAILLDELSFASSKSSLQEFIHANQ